MRKLGQIFKKQGGWTAVAIVGSAVIGAVASDRASDSAAEGQQRAIDAQNELIGPFSDFGKANIPQLQEFVDNGNNFSDTQAFKDITNISKAGGSFGSGNRATALTDYYANNFRPQRFNELFSLVGLGSNAATGQATNVGNAEIGKGNANAAGTLGAANSLNSGIQGLTFLNTLNNSNNASTQTQVNSLLDKPGNF